MKNTKILNIAVGVVMLLGIIFWIRIEMNGAALESNANLQASVLNPFSYLTFILLIIAVGSTLIFSIINLAKNPANLKKALIGLAFMAIILLIAYSIAPDNVVRDIKGKELVTTTVSKWVSTGIWYSIILGGIGFIFFIFDFVKSLIK